MRREVSPSGSVETLAHHPDPRDEALCKLYSVEGYRLAARHLSPGGVVVTQASSPYFARTAFWSIAATMAESGLHVLPYHTLVPSFGEWGFVAYSNFSYRGPALTNDATFLDGEVVDLEEDRNTGRPKATVKATMTNQDGEVMATGTADVLLPTP